MNNLFSISYSTAFDRDIESKLRFIDTIFYDDNNPSLLIKSLKTENDELANMLIRENIRVDAMDQQGNNALHIAAIVGNLNILKLLLKDHLSDNLTNNKGHTSFTLACKYGHKDIVKYLIEKGTNISHLTSSQSSGLIYASIHGFDEIVELILKTYREKMSVNMNIDLKNQDGRNALMYAVIIGNVKIVKLLIDAGADVNQVDDSKYSVLMIAASAKHQNVNEIIDLLLDAGADLEYYVGSFLKIISAREMVDRCKNRQTQSFTDCCFDNIFSNV